MSDFGYELSLLKIPVTNVRQCADFYRDALGFNEEFVMEEYGWAQLTGGGLPLALYKPGMGGGDGHVGGSVGFHLVMPGDRFDALSADLLMRGALVEDRVHTSDDGGTFIDVRDPDGNVLKIMRAEAELAG